MDYLTRSEINEIVIMGNKTLEAGLIKLTDTVEMMATALNESTTQSKLAMAYMQSETKLNDEKFTNVNNQIEKLFDLITETSAKLLIIQTEKIPYLESKVAKNTFSTSRIWQIILAVSTIILTIVGTAIVKSK